MWTVPKGLETTGSAQQASRAATVYFSRSRTEDCRLFRRSGFIALVSYLAENGRRSEEFHMRLESF